MGSTDGLIATVIAGIDAGWADTVLTSDNLGTLVWSASHGQAERHGMLTVERPGVRAVSLAPAGCDQRRVRMALQVSARLGCVRRRGGWAPAYLTSPLRPDTPDDLVRIPHLVTARTDTRELVDDACRRHGLTDTVAWELMARAAACRWFGAALPDQSLVEAHLPDLLALRSAARAGRFPPTTAGARLAALLHGRPLPLSTVLVYRRLDLFRELFAETSEVST